MNEVEAVKSDRHIVLYDGDCAMCTFQKRCLTWMDWCDVVSFVPISEAQEKGLAPTLSREDLLEAIHCLALDGRIHRGARCIRLSGCGCRFSFHWHCSCGFLGSYGWLKSYIDGSVAIGM